MRILILTSSSGGGHVRAGGNLKAAFAQVAPEVRVDIADSYDFVHPFKKWQYTRVWEFVTRYVPWLYRPVRNLTVQHAWTVRAARRGFGSAAHKLAAWVEREESTGGAFDAVLATHPHGAGVCSLFKESSDRTQLYLGQVYTDFQFHAFYLTPGVSRYFAPAASIAAAVTRADPQARVTVSGMPIHPLFAVSVSKREARAAFGIPDDGRPVVLVSRGSFGWGHRLTLDIVRELLASNLALHVVAHAGTNATLHTQFSKLIAQASHARTFGHVLGWVDTMPTLLAATDLYVGKPGGMQVAECMARGVPMAVFDPIPGQEDANVEFIEQQGVGLRVRSARQVLDWVTRCTSNHDEAEKIRGALREIGKPEGSLTIARTVLADLKH